MKTKKLSFKEISGVMSRSEMKKIMAGSGTGACPGDGFWTDSTGCGTIHLIGSSPGNCQYKITYTAYQPCGWA